MSDQVRELIVILAVASVVGMTIVISASGPQVGSASEYPEYPDEEVAVTCYKWVDDGEARVQCPDSVFAPDRAINITVKDCSEYEYANDEPHPCPGWRNDE